jgi:hypothetical protein
MLLLLFLAGGVFAISALVFLFSFIRERKKSREETHGTTTKLWLAAISLMLLYYMTVLYKNEGVFYFPAPFQDYRFSLLDIAAYIPFLLLALIFPLVRITVPVLRASSWSFATKGLFLINMLFYLGFIILFYYWGFYSIF